MHGNVDEWTSDAFAPYHNSSVLDVEQSMSEWKVTRGGAHGTYIYFLRSAARSGSLPEQRTWIIGIRLVLEIGTDVEIQRGEQPRNVYANVFL